MKILGSASTASEQKAEAALAAIAQWQGQTVRYSPGQQASMSPMHRAVDSDCWTVRVDGHHELFFLKVGNDDLVMPASLTDAYRAAESASRKGLTPRPRHLIESSQAAIFDFLGPDWRTAHMDDLGRIEILQNIVAVKREIHVLPPFARTNDVFADVAMLAAEAACRSLALPADASVLLAAVTRMGSAIAAAGVDRCPCHADGVASNVMIGPGNAIQLVDFDEAGNADPLFDFAILFNEAGLLEHDLRQALEMAEGLARESSVSRCRFYACADDLRWGLWGLLMDATSPRQGIEFLKYAQWRLLRCRMALRAMPLDMLLKSV